MWAPLRNVMISRREMLGMEPVYKPVSGDRYNLDMYIVLSKWEFDPQYEQEVRTSSGEMMEAVRSWPDVEFAYNVRTGPANVVAVIGYKDEQAYQRLVHGPDSSFEKAAKQYGIEDHARWLWSERGEQVDS